MSISEKIIKLDAARNKAEEAYIREKNEKKAEKLLGRINDALINIRTYLLKASSEEEYFDKYESTDKKKRKSRKKETCSKKEEE